MKKTLTLSLAAVLGFTACTDPLEEIKDVSFPQLFSPANLEVTVHKQTKAILTWESVANATDYSVELYQATNLDSPLKKDSTDNTTYTFEGLTEDLEYEVHICANSPDLPQSKWAKVTFDTKPIKYETLEWNISDSEFDILPASIAKDSSYTVRGLEFIAGAGNMRALSDVTKTYGDITFTRRMNTNGASVYNVDDPKLNARLVRLGANVTKNGVLEVYAQSNGTDNRVLQILDKDGKAVGELATPANSGDEVGVLRIPCSEKAEYYIFGKASINIYMVRLLVNAIYETDPTSTLKSLAVTGETLSPAFDPNTFEYTVEVPNSTKEVTITVEKSHIKQTVEGDGKYTLSTGTTYIDEFIVKVTSEDEENTNGYTIVVKRKEAASSDATLKTLTVSGGGTLTPALSPDVTEYTDTVPYSVESVTITGEANHKFAKVGDGGIITAESLEVGNNGPYSLVVLAEDLSVKTYTVTVVRKPEQTTPSEGVDKEWNFSSEAFKNALPSSETSNTIVAGSTIDVDGLTIISGTSTMTYGTNSKSADGYSFTYRLQLGGTGSTTSRTVKFDVTGSCTIAVYMITGSGSNVRPLVVHNGTDELTRLNTEGSDIKKYEYSYTGGAGTIYLYSGDSGINLYLVKVDY
ncbi:MAG: cadherin-like beta sandwich domain-containing protein [Prevotellaceae bacterium]|jgi:hypothetical protein|nr:cadherin-like beta sandwich domain-containing protein [Prevotellaceae bacterium]